MPDKRTSLREKLRIEKDLQRDGIAPKSRVHIHNVIAQHTLDQDLGLEGENITAYDLDDETRDRLIAHARQDASLAVVIATAVENQLRVLRLIVLVGFAAVILLLLL